MLPETTLSEPIDHGGERVLDQHANFPANSGENPAPMRHFMQAVQDKNGVEHGGDSGAAAADSEDNSAGAGGSSGESASDRTPPRGRVCASGAASSGGARRARGCVGRWFPRWANF